MSELKVNSIAGTGASSAAITIDASDGTATGKFTNIPSRNLIINGDQTISQRVVATETTPANGDYCLDRWKAGLAQAGKWKYQQVTESPDEFTKSIVLTSTSAYTPTSDDHFFLEQLIEGYNAAHLAYGTASAKTTTLSFWIKSSIGTGTYGGALSNSAGDRSYVWAVSVTGTGWQRVNVVIPGDTSGTWVKDTGIGLKVRFNLGNAGTWSATAGSWGAGNKTGNSANVHLVATSAATLHITGVQLEVGDVATEFEFKRFNDDLRACQRYYCKTYAHATAPGTDTWEDMHGRQSDAGSNSYAGPGVWYYPGGEMRAKPTCVLYSKDGDTGKINIDNSEGPGTMPAVHQGTKAMLAYRNNDSTGSSGAGNNIAFHATATAEL